MNLYQPNPLLDSPLRPQRPGMALPPARRRRASLTSRLSQLAPVSFTNTIDGQRRRRLVRRSIAGRRTTSSGPTTTPRRAFANNSPVHPDAERQLPRPELNRAAHPSLAQRDKKINLNYPLPVSNDPNEPIRQKWISDTYQLLKVILPPDSVDTPEELAQLSQFVINIIDFRDPDCHDDPLGQPGRRDHPRHRSLRPSCPHL